MSVKRTRMTEEQLAAVREEARKRAKVGLSKPAVQAQAQKAGEQLATDTRKANAAPLHAVGAKTNTSGNKNNGLSYIERKLPDGRIEHDYQGKAENVVLPSERDIAKTPGGKAAASVQAGHAAADTQAATAQAAAAAGQSSGPSAAADQAKQAAMSMADAANKTAAAGTNVAKAPAGPQDPAKVTAQKAAAQKATMLAAQTAALAARLKAKKAA